MSVAAIKAARERACSTCGATPGQWCVFVRGPDCGYIRPVMHACRWPTQDEGPEDLPPSEPHPHPGQVEGDDVSSDRP